MNQKMIYATLKEKIVEILNREEKSISSISKELEKDGIKIHRLILTGYLQALRDLNILKEKEIQPSKIYSVLSNDEKTIYEIIGGYVSEHPESSDLCLYILYKIFKRPILKWELDKCGVGRPEQCDKVYGDERKNAIAILESMNINVPKNMPAYIPKKEYREELEEILIKMVIDSFSLQKYMQVKGTQMKIDSI